MEGFIVIDYAHRFAEATRQMRAWIEAGRLTQKVTVIDGFVELPRALIKLFEGFNTGKLMVRTD
jgi:NADPH-dependent curcumin reductase CurA